ncbi:MAG TPA: baseplate J/gp47 family protein [Chloroflexota bacterium]|nr:baseplate J/gp47 family protein [Chloroflexota bacterium]
MALNVAPTAHQSIVSDSVHCIVADEFDDPSSLRGKLSAVSGQRVVLVIPDENEMIENPIAFRLLARAATLESITLAIVSQRARLRELALEEGIAAFGSQAEVPRPEKPEMDNGLDLPPWRIALAKAQPALAYAMRLAVAILLVLSLVAIIVLAVPEAVVTVRPFTDQLSGKVQIHASTDAQSVDPSKAILPARVIYLPLTSSGTIPVNFPDHPMDGRAVGYITFENRVTDQLPIPVGTDVSTFSGVHFQTSAPAILPGHLGATVTVPIVATAPGSYANVQRGQIVVVNGPLHWLVTAVNESEIAGGGPAGQPVVTAWETSKLINQVTADARKTAIQQITSQIHGDEVFVPESIQVTPIEEKFDQPIGSISKTLTVHVQWRISALIVNRFDLNALATQVWHPQIRQGFVLRPDSVQVLSPSVVQVNDSSATFEVPMRAVAYAAVNTERVAPYVRLRSPAAAERDLAHQFDLSTPPTVRIIPSWLPRAYRVQVIIDTSAPLSKGTTTQP